MKIRKTGYFISAALYIVNSIISVIFGLNTHNTWWAMLGLFAIITPSFVQTIFNIRANKGQDNIIILYIICVFLGFCYIPWTIILCIGIFGNVNFPLY